MRCQMCGASLTSTITELPSKLRESSIVIIRGLPVLQCGKCSEYLLEDHVMARVEQLLKLVHEGTELEIVHFAA